MRAFAFALLFALALLPRTGWIVRNEADLLRGRWESGLAWDEFSAPAPVWPLRKESLDDPVARALALDSADFGAKWRERQNVLDDPRLRPLVRGPLLRRSFTAAIVSLDRAASTEKRAIALRLLPLATEGERADPANAYYPTAAFALDVLLDRPEAAKADLSRAARCERFDNTAFEEPDLFMEEFERQYGYRGSLVRLVEEASVLFPDVTAYRNAAERFERGLPLRDPARRDLLRLSETMVRTSPTIFEMLVGRTMFYRALGEPPFHGTRSPSQTAAAQADAVHGFRAANPYWDDQGAVALMARLRSPQPFVSGNPSWAVAWAPVVGAGLLLALLGGLLAAWPARREPDESIDARLRRASWAWLAIVPAAVIDDGRWFALAAPTFAALGVAIAVLNRRRQVRPAMALGIVACGLGLVLAPWGWFLPPALWAAGVACPARWRPVGWTLAIAGFGIGAAFQSVHSPPPATVYAWFVVGLFALRLLLPLRRATAGWVPGALAALYMGGVALELRADAQIAETTRQWSGEAARFRESLSAKQGLSAAPPAAVGVVGRAEPFQMDLGT